MPDDDLNRKIDKLIGAVQDQNVKISNIDGKVDMMNDRINAIDDRLQDMQGIVLRREGAVSSIEDIKKDLNTKIMWGLSYCIALGMLIIALLKFH